MKDRNLLFYRCDGKVIIGIITYALDAISADNDKHRLNAKIAVVSGEDVVTDAPFSLCHVLYAQQRTWATTLTAVRRPKNALLDHQGCMQGMNENGSQP